jgi:hypothetical protein
MKVCDIIKISKALCASGGLACSENYRFLYSGFCEFGLRVKAWVRDREGQKKPVQKTIVF